MSADAAGGAQTSTTSADGGAKGGATDNQNKQVAFEDHKRALDDLHRFKQKAFDAEKAASDLKARLEAFDKTQKESQGDFKSLSEQYKTSADEWKSKYEGLKGTMVLTEKYKAASQALLKAGMKPEALKILEKDEFKDLEVEATTSGRFIVHGTDLYVDKFKQEFPFAFGTGQPPTINNGGGGAGASEEMITPAKLLEIERAAKAKGDMTEYHKAFKKYAEQRQKLKQ
jgi:hypothetical protein